MLRCGRQVLLTVYYYYYYCCWLFWCALSWILDFEEPFWLQNCSVRTGRFLRASTALSVVQCGTPNWPFVLRLKHTNGKLRFHLRGASSISTDPKRALHTRSRSVRPEARSPAAGPNENARLSHGLPPPLAVVRPTHSSSPHVQQSSVYVLSAPSPLPSSFLASSYAGRQEEEEAD